MKLEQIMSQIYNKLKPRSILPKVLDTLNNQGQWVTLNLRYILR